MSSKPKELFWKVWWNTPWCVINRNCKIRNARKNFDYDKNKDISIIATNCIGGEIYSVLGLQFTSPFINCSLARNDFVRLAANFREYMGGELKDFFYNARGELSCYLSCDGLEPLAISWPHDNSKESIVKNFEKRSKRVNYDKLVFITDDIGLKEESYEIFENIQAYKKVIISSAQCDKEYDFIEKLNRDTVQGLQYKMLSGVFRFQKIWDFVKWFNR